MLRMLRITALTMALVAASATGAWAKGNETVQRILNALEAGKFEQVLELADDALEEKDVSKLESARLHYLAAQAHVGLGKYADAVTAFEAVLVERPRATPAVVGLGQAEAKLGHADKARAAFERALKLGPKDPTANLAYGEFLTSKGKLDDALTYLQAAEKRLGSDSRMARAMVELRLRRDEPDEAMARADVQVKHAEKHPMGHFLRALVLERRQQGEQAIETYERALALDDTFLDAHKNLAILCHTDNPTYADIARTKKAFKHYERYFALGGRDARLKRYYETTKKFIGPMLAANPNGLPYFNEQAKAPKQAAMQWVLGILAADVKRLARVIHWDRVHARLKSAGADTTDTPAALKEQTMAEYGRTLKAQGPAPMIEMALKQRVDTLTASKQADGSVRIAFPPELGGKTLTVQAIDDVWFVVVLPKK